MNEGINFVKPSVDFNVVVAITSPSIAMVKNSQFFTNILPV